MQLSMNIVIAQISSFSSVSFSLQTIDTNNFFKYKVYFNLTNSYLLPPSRSLLFFQQHQHQHQFVLDYS